LRRCRSIWRVRGCECGLVGAHGSIVWAFWRVTIASLGIGMPMYVLWAGWTKDTVALYR
jgi:hypothetical protein